MATRQNVPQSVEQSKLTVVPFPAPQAITQLELAVLLSLRGRLHQLQEQVESAEQSIKTRLEAGVTPESGDHRAELRENFRRNVSWKDVVVRLAERLEAGRQSLLREGSLQHQADSHGLSRHRVAPKHAGGCFLAVRVSGALVRSAAAPMRNAGRFGGDHEST